MFRVKNSLDVLFKERFLFLLNALRFDNSEDRRDRSKENADSAISDLMLCFINNSQGCFEMGDSVSVDASRM